MNARRQGSDVDAEWAFARYEQIRDRLVQTTFAARSEHVSDLGAVADLYDAFVLDAFGVLNVGEVAVPGAIERVAGLRARGKRLVLLTNGATHSRAQALAKYHALGFDFTGEEVVASRDLAATALRDWPDGGLIWAAAAGPAPDFTDLGLPVADLLADDGLFDTADGFVLFSSSDWTPCHQERLLDALARRPRPLLIANPDLVAPREHGFSLEPGHFAHLVQDALGLAPAFYGKPYANAFDAARARLGDANPPARIAMVGDTLHTDVLGGRAAGMGTVLVTNHGLFKGLDVERYIARSAIVPDVVAADI